MNRARVEAALPASVVDWLRKSATPGTWDAVARDVAEAAGRELIADAGSRGWDIGARARLHSPAALAVAATLDRGIWTANLVAPRLATYFELFTATDDLRRRLTRPSTLAEMLPTPPPDGAGI